jgi:pyruvate dehydrogenase complex dehydrogenase (E1) component
VRRTPLMSRIRPAMRLQVIGVARDHLDQQVDASTKSPYLHDLGDLCEGGRSSYLRLSTRPMHQDLAGAPGDPAARERRRRHVVAGAYALRPCPHPDVTIVAVGAMVTEAVQAAERLAHNGIAAEVVCVISPGLLFDAARARQGLGDAPSWIVDQGSPPTAPHRW